ncbi:hypothetical protein D3C87_1240080 [compost metagenome]
MQANHERVVAGLVVRRHAGDAERPAPVHAIGAQCAANPGETADQHAAGEIRTECATVGAGGDDLIALAVVETGIQAHARWYQVLDAQVLRGAFGQGDDDVVAHAFANHQIAAGGVTGAGIAGIQRTVGKDLVDHWRGNQLIGQIGEVGGGEIVAAVDAGVIRQRCAGLQGAAGLNGGADDDVVTDHHHIGAAGVGSRAAAPSEKGGLAAGIEEGDLVAADAVIGAKHQQGAVAAIDLQIGCRQAAADKTQSAGQGNGGADIECAAPTGILNRSHQAQLVSTVDIADVAVHG